LRIVLAQGATIAVGGALAGSVAALGLTRLMTKLLYSVGALDPATFLLAPLALALIAMLACYMPSRRAMRVDPLIALRHE
jgi:putative ABC transport system permease protein